MPNVTREEWQEWQNHPATLAIKEAIVERIAESKDKIVHSTDPDFDRFIKGMIWAFHEVLEARPEVIIDEVNDDSEDAAD